MNTKLKDVIDALKRTVEETENNGYRTIIFPVSDAKILVEKLDRLLKHAIIDPHWDKNGFLDGGNIYVDGVNEGHIDPKGEQGTPGQPGLISKIDKIKWILHSPDHEFRFQMAGTFTTEPICKCGICEQMVNSIVQTAYHKHNNSTISICNNCYQLFNVVDP